MTKWAGDDGLAFLSGMLIGQGDIVSAEPARMIRAMGAMVRGRPEVVTRLAAGDRAAVDALPELRAAFDRLHREVRRSLHAGAEAGEPDAARGSRAGADGDCGGRCAQGAPARGCSRTRTCTADPELGKRMLARWLLDWAKARVRDRENLRFERTRLFGRVRRIFLALGARLTEAGVLDHRATCST